MRVNYKIVLYVLLAAYFLFLFRADLFGNVQLNRNYTALKIQLENEQKLNQELKAQLQKLQKEDCIEQMARVKLGMVKPKEKAYKVFMED